MKKLTRKAIALVLSAALMVSLFALVPSVSAAEKEPQLVIKTESNFFPVTQNTYYDLSELEDENGDIFITFEFKICAQGKYLINLDIDQVCWDNTVLEWKAEYNQKKVGRYNRLYILPFAVDSNLGGGMYNTFGENSGRLIANYTSVSPAAYAYAEDGGYVTVVRSVFKLLDKNAKEITVCCDLDTLSLCDETLAEPYSQYPVISCCDLNSKNYALAEYETVITPASQKGPVIGDLDGDGELTIQDATKLQMYLGEYEDENGNPLFDLSDPEVFALADINGDNKVNIRDVTAAQRILEGY